MESTQGTVFSQEQSSLSSKAQTSTVRELLVALLGPQNFHMRLAIGLSTSEKAPADTLQWYDMLVLQVGGCLAVLPAVSVA